MSGGAFFDTNVPLYLLSADTVRCARAVDLLAEGGTIAALVSLPIPTVEYDLTAGDYVEMFVQQNSGGSLNTVTGAGINSPGASTRPRGRRSRTRLPA